MKHARSISCRTITVGGFPTPTNVLASRAGWSACWSPGRVEPSGGDGVARTASTDHDPGLAGGYQGVTDCGAEVAGLGAGGDRARLIA